MLHPADQERLALSPLAAVSRRPDPGLDSLEKAALPPAPAAAEAEEAPLPVGPLPDEEDITERF